MRKNALKHAFKLLSLICHIIILTANGRHGASLEKGFKWSFFRKLINIGDIKLMFQLIKYS